MDAVFQFFTRSAQELPINGFSGTMTINLAFIFLAYIWHPVVGWAYHRMRAYRAWRAIEKRQAVEVTTYPALTEALGRQGMCACDAARLIAVALGAFYIASWGLELTMDLYALENSAWLLTLPPPVVRESNEKDSTWTILALDNIWERYGDDVLSAPELKNINDNDAKSYYLVQDFEEHYLGDTYDKYVEGEVIVADWNPSDKPALSYGVVDDTVMVEEVICSSGDPLKDAPVHIENGAGETELWGTVMECEEGPKLLAQNASQPAIILTKSATRELPEETYVVVEETAEKLSFLYSVWTAVDDSSGNLRYKFHISSTVRMAEAVVTTIVNGKPEGRSCFSLLRAYSMRIRDGFESTQNPKASPFGENPKISSKLGSLQDVETIEAGVDVNNFSMICFVLLMVLSVTGIVWSLCLRSSIPIDIYDRDALIRAVSLQGQQSSARDLGAKPSEIRIFVRKEDSGSLTVVVSDAVEENSRSGLKRLFRRRGTVVETPDPAPVADTFSQYNDGFGGVAVPVGPRTVWLGGVRTGMGRSFPGREGNFKYPTSAALSASPVPSDIARSFAGTPVALRSPPSSFTSPREARNAFRRDGRGPSVLFESARSLGSGESGSGGTNR